VDQVDEAEAVAEWLPEDTGPLVSDDGVGSPELEPPILLLAKQHGQAAGYVELVKVQTLLYGGMWIESLSASNELNRAALIHGAVNRAAAAGVDEIGMMAPEQDLSLRQGLREAGFRTLGGFDWFRADLPLPGLASDRPGDGVAGDEPDGIHV
jgi:hypothetical protein